MAIRQVAGGIPVYSIEVDVPKPTDSRGKGYGSLVSDLRWKLWEEVQASQLRQMEFEKMSKQAQLDVLEQKQKDISRAIRDAVETKAKIAADFDKDGGISNWMKAKSSQRGTITITEKPATDPYTGELLDFTLRTVQKRMPIGGFSEQEIETLKQKMDEGDAEATAQYNALAEQDANLRRSFLDQEIAKLEAEQAQVGQQFQDFVAQGPGQDILSRTRDAFQTQIGEGGFGISKRPLRQAPRFDEAVATQRVKDAIAAEQSNVLNKEVAPIKNRMIEIEAMFPGTEDYKAIPEWSRLSNQLDSLTSPEGLKSIRDKAAANVVSGLREAGATPTSSRGFLMKEMPQMPTYVPSSPERPPTPRGNVGVGVSGTVPLTREQELTNEIMRGGGAGREAALQSAERIVKPTVSPVDAAINRSVELEALGVQDKSWYPAAKAAVDKQVDEAIRAESEISLATGNTPGKRGFQYPVEKFTALPGRTTTIGKPADVFDQLASRRSLRDVKYPLMMGQTPATPATTPTPTTHENLSYMEDAYGNPIPPLTPQEELRQTIQDETPALKENFEQWKAKQNLMKSIEKTPEGVITPPQAKANTQARKDLYAMRVAKKGIELADKPKQFSRLAKTENPSNAPEYIKVVNGVYDVNKTRPDKFKLTYDEVARVYKDDPSTRQKAHEYLIAKDAIESNITQPLA